MRKKVFLDKFAGGYTEATRSVFEESKLRYLIEELDYRCELDWGRGAEYVMSVR